MTHGFQHSANASGRSDRPSCVEILKRHIAQCAEALPYLVGMQVPRDGCQNRLNASITCNKNPVRLTFEGKQTQRRTASPLHVGRTGVLTHGAEHKSNAILLDNRGGEPVIGVDQLAKSSAGVARDELGAVVRDKRLQNQINATRGANELCPLRSVCRAKHHAAMPLNFGRVGKLGHGSTDCAGQCVLVFFRQAFNLIQSNRGQGSDGVGWLLGLINYLRRSVLHDESVDTQRVFASTLRARRAVLHCAPAKCVALDLTVSVSPRLTPTVRLASSVG